jgi:enolase
LKAVHNVNEIIAPLLIGKDVLQQNEIDHIMISKDGTEHKTNLGANAILGVSLAVARAAAICKNVSLHQQVSTLLKAKHTNVLPTPFFNVINGGKHAGSGMPFQEFMIAPKGKDFAESLRMGAEVYHALKKAIEEKYGHSAINVGDEGGFAPQIKTAEDGLDLLMAAIKKAGYEGKVSLAMDCAASEFFKEGFYYAPQKMSAEELLEYYLHLVKKYPLISIEDPFHEDDFESFAKLRERSGIQIVGDDLLVTNIKRIKTGIEKKSCNCLLLKVNQIGSLTEALQAVEMAYSAGWKVMVSHRSGETEDSFIADLVVAIGCGQIKSGAPCRGERTAKYNQLLRIEEEMLGR